MYNKMCAPHKRVSYTRSIFTRYTLQSTTLPAIGNGYLIHLSNVGSRWTREQDTARGAVCILRACLQFHSAIRSYHIMHHIT